jgi:hypothetical protein
MSEPTGSSPADAVPVDSTTDEHAWVAAHPCACGAAWKLRSQALVEVPGLPHRYVMDRLEVRCGSDHVQQLFFRVDTESAAYRERLAEILKRMGLGG